MSESTESQPTAPTEVNVEGDDTNVNVNPPTEQPSEPESAPAESAPESGDDKSE